MALDKVIDSALLDAGMQATADAIREKTGNTDPIVWDSANGFKTAVEGIQAGGGDDGSFKAVLEGNAVNPTLPADLTKIRPYAFYYVESLEKVSLPEGLTTICSAAFMGCYNLYSINLPASLMEMHDAVFSECQSLLEITFDGTPSYIDTYAFGDCPIFTINVPWAEGEVSGAPWSATEATINYNYTGG